MNSTRRLPAIAVALVVLVLAAWFFWRQCGPAQLAPSTAKQNNEVSTKSKPEISKGIKPEEAEATIQNNVPPAKEEIDLAPPVQLTASEQLPNVAKCVTRNFPAEARPHVNLAIVTVRLVVDKFGNVRSDTPVAVEFPQEIDEDLIPAMRKLFIQAGSHAFGNKKCPPHVVNGQNFGYAIEVPLKYTP